ncbi:hypothetical protein BSKO_13259 [Bryopsis sp. KO-2023]|nr:hypothetical protein BSKO_13259 [Bryopsis sp. KO-2023]
MRIPRLVFIATLLMSALLTCESHGDTGVLRAARRLQQQLCEEQIGAYCVVSGGTTVAGSSAGASGVRSSTLRVGETGDGQGYLFYETSGDPGASSAAPRRRRGDYDDGVDYDDRTDADGGSDGDSRPGPRRVFISSDVSQLPFAPPWGGVAPFANVRRGGFPGLTNEEVFDLYTGRR